MIDYQEAAEMIRNDMKLHHDFLSGKYRKALNMAIFALQAQDAPDTNAGDMVSRQKAIDALCRRCDLVSDDEPCTEECNDIKILKMLPSAQPEIIRCKDCKYWRQQTNYQGVLLSFGFCESEEMWRSLYGETCEVAHIDTDDDHYCGYSERRTDE